MMGTHVRVTFENACTAVMPAAVLLLLRPPDGSAYAVQVGRDSANDSNRITPAEYTRLAALLTGEGKVANEAEHYRKMHELDEGEQASLRQEILDLRERLADSIPKDRLRQRAASWRRGIAHNRSNKEIAHMLETLAGCVEPPPDPRTPKRATKCDVCATPVGDILVGYTRDHDTDTIWCHGCYGRSAPPPDPRTPGQVAYEVFREEFGTTLDWDELTGGAQGAWDVTAAAVLAHGRGEVMTRSENSEVVVAACEECPAYAPTSYGCDWCSLGQFEAPRGEVAAACPLRKGPIVLRLKEGV